MSIAEPADRSLAGPAPRRKGVSRRTVLGAALAGGAGVAAIRLWGQNALERVIPGARPAAGGRGDWVSPLGGEAALVAHLLRRATFGATPAELEAAVSAGFQKTVDRLIESPPAAPPAFGGDPAGFTRLNVGELQQWWIDHILTTPTPFAERMTLFWHGHFTSDFRKVGLQTPFIYWQNLTWRQMAMTDLRSMLLKVTTDPAMLRYLDLGVSTGANPNENYARELMELFTLGAGNYTEDDVRAAAKALAGWVEPRPSRTVDVTLDAKNSVTRRLPVYDSPASAVFNPRRAYDGQVTFLKKTARFDTQMVLDQILAQPAVAPFIATKVLQHFVMAQPPRDYVVRLADQFRRSKYDMKTLMRAVFTSAEFASPQAYRGLVKSPIEYMVSAVKALGLPPSPQLAKLILGSAPNLGQVLFDPPDVGGWPNNEAWISSNNVVARVNFASALLALAKQPPAAQDAPARQLEGVLSASTAAAFNQAADDRTRWLLVLASPEFQLK